MATKRIKSPGEFGSAYWDLAAKQFSWPIDHTEKSINVPEDELQYAEDDLMVQHFRKHGWHIQSCISVEHTKIFVKPQIPLSGMFRGDIKPIKEEPQQPFKCNEKFLIKSTDTRVMICEITKKLIALQYLDVKKENIITTEQNLSRSIKMGVFVRI